MKIVNMAVPILLESNALRATRDVLVFTVKAALKSDRNYSGSIATAVFTC